MTEVLDPPAPALPAPVLPADVVAARAAVEALLGLEPWRLQDADLLAYRVELERIGAMFDAVRLAATADIDSRGAAVAAGASSTRAWLASACGQHPGAAHAETRLAEALRHAPAVVAAMRDGSCSRVAASIVTETITEVASYAPERVAEAEAFLLRQARVLGPKPLAVVARRLAHTLDPDHGTRLERELARQHDRRHLTLVDRRDGSLALSGLLDREAGVLLRTALDPLAKPRPASDGTRDPRSAGQRDADAVLALAQLALAHQDLPDTGGLRPHVTLTVSLDTLTGTSPAPGELDRGGPLDAETARRIGCDATLSLLTLDRGGVPLILGRATRTPSPGQLRALAARDSGCAFPGCDRPVAWTQAHHVVHWARGGATDLANLVLLCGHHHRVIHHDGWSVVIEEDGMPTFRPPPWLDPARTPLRQPRVELLL